MSNGFQQSRFPKNEYGKYSKKDRFEISFR